MTDHLAARPPAREAGAELLVLARWEEHAAWLLQHTARWPKSARFTLCRRVQDHALEVAELLVVAGTTATGAPWPWPARTSCSSACACSSVSHEPRT